MMCNASWEFRVALTIRIRQWTPLICALLLPNALPAQDAYWGIPSHKDARLDSINPQESKLTSVNAIQYTVLANQAAPIESGKFFEIAVTLQLDPGTRALPELACFDAAGKEIPTPNALDKAPKEMTTRAQTIKRLFPPCPQTATVRPRLRAEGKGSIRIRDLSLKATNIDTYTTGMLVNPPHPKLRHGLVLESNHGIENRSRLVRDDKDNDGLWAVIDTDLDEMSRLETPGDDWRSNFAGDPNAIFWSDGTVLKSDTVSDDRHPNTRDALHWKMRVRPGPYRVYLSDPGRAVSVSLNGLDWKRYEGGQEIDLGVQPMANSFLEFWLDACHKDPVSAGPAYFDYVRLMPVAETSRGAALAAAALKNKPPRVTQSSVDDRRIPVAIDNAPNGWPVRTSIPIARGELADANQSTVLAPDGRPVPTQAKALASWPDGSIKWLHLDFASTGASRYTVSYGRNVRGIAPPGAVRTEETGAGIAVDTGAIKFNVPRGRFGLVEYNGRPMQIEIAETAGRTWRSLDLPAIKLEVEQPGPYHAIIVAETWMPASGKSASGFHHRARIHAYAGSPVVHVDYFVANTDARTKVDVRAISLHIPTGAQFTPPPPQTPPAAKATPTPAPRGKALARTKTNKKKKTARKTAPAPTPPTPTLRPPPPPPVSVFTQLALTQTANANGWASNGGISAGLADFREQYPKAIRTRNGEIQIDLWAPEGGAYEWFQGVGKTHHLAFSFAHPAAEAALLAQGPLIAFPTDPGAIAATQAFGSISTASASPLSGVERTLANHIADPVIAKLGYGFENYGDHSSSGYVKGTFLWDNNEYDLPAAAMVHFARTGDRPALRAALAAALHYADVDTIHYSATNANYHGAAWTHSHGTFGHHTAEPPGMSHAGYTQGLIWYTYLTGNPEGLNAARSIADWCLRNIRPERNVNAMERALGHPLMTLTDVYEATGDEKYLKGAAKLVDWALQWEHPERGGHLASITEKPAYYSGSPFCSGLLTAGLMKFNDWARDEDVSAMLERTGRWVLTDMWRPAGLFNKGAGTPSAANISTHLRLMSALYAKTRDPLFLAVPYELTLLGYGGDIRPFGTRYTGLVFNYLPWFLAMLRAEGSPEPDLALVVETENVTVHPGYKTQVTFTVRNAGTDDIREIATSFQPRLDFKLLKETGAPEILYPGQLRRLTYEVEAPTDINLTHGLNRESYAHWSARFTRGGRPRFAHGYTKILIVP